MESLLTCTGRSATMDRMSSAFAAAQGGMERMAAAAQSQARELAAAAQNRAEDLAAAERRMAAAAQLQARELAAAAQNKAEDLAAAVQDGAERAASQVSLAAQSGVEQVSNAAENVRSSVRESSKSIPTLSSASVQPSWMSSSSRDDIREAWGDCEPGTRTKPPLYLRMVSADSLCPCSMEVEWEDGSGERQHWSSYRHPVCSFFEAEKVLPSNVTHVSVRFKVHALVNHYYVSRAVRGEKCQFIYDESGNAEPEVFWFWSDRDSQSAFDVTFELKGTPESRYVWRAWNAARGSGQPRRSWERWDDLDSRPCPRARLPVLKAADEAVLPGVHTVDPVQHCKVVSQRLVAAAKALQDVRRETLSRLRMMDQHFTGQWVAVNSTNTVGAGLAVASAATLFFAPPVGVGLGIASAVTSGAATAGDALADKVVVAHLRRLLADDDACTFAVASLQQEWLQARDSAHAALKACGKSVGAMSLEEIAIYGTQGVQVGLAIANTAVVLADTAGRAAAAAGSAAVVAESATVAGRIAPVATKVFGVAGAVISTGMAVHGWATTKSLQSFARRRLAEISSSTLDTQRWLAAMSQLECPICLGNIELLEQVTCCRDSWHYAHRHCIGQWTEECQSRGREATCPLCCGALSSRSGLLEELIREDICSLSAPETSA